MKKHILIASIIGVAITPFTNATTVGFAVSPTARTVQTSTGTALAAGASLVLVGNFLSESFSVNAALTTLQNYNAISAAGGWEQFTFDTVTGDRNTGATSTYAISTALPGKLSGTGTDNNDTPQPAPPNTKADYFNGKQIYVWVFNASSIAAATQMGIFKAAPWLFPTNAGGIGDSIQLSTLNTTAVVGVSGVGNVTTGVIGLAPVPEPSTALLSAVGLAAMALRRRRSRS